mmetsp:Transcript_43760/g.133168  ORF Transcript_43760/g.133168 Transcript_43760/m.133168 type:complete len:594 (-) Transcript_43760:73-1854(-)
MADWHSSSSAAGSGGVEVGDDDDHLPFVSRRSPVLCTNGCVSSSQPLASSVGLRVLRDMGGNAADAAVAVAAVLAVTEPCSTGLGGDMFALHYSSESRTVSAVNGSGRAPAGLDLDVLREGCPTDGGSEGGISTEKFEASPHVVTVPGAAKGWEDFLKRHGSGRLSLAELMEPAAKLAEEGFPVAPMTALHWSRGIDSLVRRWVEPGEVVPLTVDGKRGPRPGDLFRNPDMARVLRSLGSKGAAEGFYQGETGKAIVEALRKRGGVMTMEDLASHESTFPDPVCADYRGMKLWQVPPNGQGIAGLIALTGLAALEERGLVRKVASRKDLGDRNSETLHALIEMMRLGFGDARAYVCDPDFLADAKGGKTNEWLLDKPRIGDRAGDIYDPSKAVAQGHPSPESCTVSFQVVDSTGNAVSFVNSNFMGFGTGIVPDGTGFSLQNRGAGFSLDPTHPNALEPRKRPFHTIIPGMITHGDGDDLYATMSNMGGFMQPQGHLQLTVALVAAGLDPQEAVDLPRFCVADGTQNGTVLIEDGVAEEVVQNLEGKGHNMKAGVAGHDRSIFGRAQIIKRDRDTGVLWAGSDGRSDGCAMGY